MGSWNETCALTRLPIRAGMPVVALTTVAGPDYEAHVSSGLKTDLLFGFPLKGVYDDYGGIEQLANPALNALHETAFAETGYYRRHRFTEYGSAASHWIASDPDTLWSCDKHIKPLYYPGVLKRPSEADDMAPAIREKSLACFRLAQEAIKQLGTRLSTATFPEKNGRDHVFGLIEEVFGTDRAWGAWEVLRRHGLFASQETLLMHEAAYASMVTTFGNNKVNYYQDKKRYALREFLAKQLDEFLDAFTAKYAEADSLGALLSKGDERVRRKKTLEFMHLGREYAYLKPMTQLWMAPELPLIGHVWGGASLKAITAAVPREEILDYLVFQWARYYLRLDFVKPPAGSQNDEARLPASLFSATVVAMKAQDYFRHDFEGTLHH